ncbi:MAG: DNA translocase FtsK 4TM domain-containing protein [Byssovorax sp.]
MAFPLFAPRRAQTAGGPPEAAEAPARSAAPRRKNEPIAPAAATRPVHGYAREAAALVLLASALYTVLALLSYRGDPLRPEVAGADWVGPVGATCAGALAETIGLAAWFIPIELGLLATPLLNGKPSIAGVARFAGDLLVLIILAALGHVAFPHATAFGAMPLGGSVGELFGEVLRALFSSIGSYIIGLTVVGLILVGRATFSFIEQVKRLERAFVALCERVSGWMRALGGAWSAAREIDRQKGEEDKRAAGPKIARPSKTDAIIAALTEEEIESARARDSGVDVAIASSSVVEPAVRLPLTGAPEAQAPFTVGAASTVAEPAAPPIAPVKPIAAAPKIAADARADAPSGPTLESAAPKRRGKRAAAAEPPAPVIVLHRDEDNKRPSVPAALIDELCADSSPAVAERAIDAGEIATSTIDANEIDAGEIAASAIDAARAAAPVEASSIVEETAGALLRDEVPTPSPILPVASPKPVAPPAPSPKAERKIEEPAAPVIVDTAPAAKVVPAAKVKVVPAVGQGFRLPSFDMLDEPTEGKAAIDEEQLKLTAQMLEKTLSDYGVSGRVEEIHPGPTVTTFEVSPAAGTKVSKVAGLADDLALGLSRKVRIIAPIPGKNRIGFEVPNDHRVPVSLRELIEDRRFQEMKAPLPCVLGRDIIGTPYFADMASMPHVIVAGATGAGKSVGLNVMLVSLLFRRTPAELRLLMIDPKVVELAPFDRIPHMLLPVVTDMKQASNALKWAVDEMERRYQLFANAGTKNITTYNAWVEKVHRGEARPPKPPAKVSAVGPDGLEVEVDAAKDGTDAALPEKIPFIVIVVDEFADLMMQQGKDVEASVARLAQKARAAGMHVILATQRPSVDVITGMIKANFPTRIAFRVAQKVDSRTILDEQGAEHLLGRGDMLIKMNGSNDTRRVQCPFCSEEEVQRITDFLRLQGEPVYDESILKPRDEEGAEPEDEDAESDAMYDAAVRIVADTRRCSTSWIQRKLGIGYNRAAKIVEAMEKRGLVGPANGAKDREVLIAPL